MFDALFLSPPMPHVSDLLNEYVQRAANVLDGARLHGQVLLAPYTTFRIGGPADVLYDATSAEELANAVVLARAVGVPYFVLGTGANILVGDRGFRGVVVRNLARAMKFLDQDRLWAESGAIVHDLIVASIERQLSGLEHFVGIPSTLGGALWQNLHFLSPAPARERTMFLEELVESVELLGTHNERTTVDRAHMKFGYDTSILHYSGDIALAATLRLAAADANDMHRVMQENLSWRGARHPWLEIHPSAGSIFKKIEGVGAGRLVDQCGLKGYRVGDAQISHIHANIILNLGHATAADVRAIIDHAQKMVAARLGYTLEPEIMFVGEFA
jgi:UDP-N-acetylmuramate dehydrogenase